MTTERIEALFAAALELAPAERANFLERECSANSELHEKLAGMLAAHERSEHLAFLAARQPGLAGEEPGGTIGPYRLCEKIGEGGWGVVYVAEQQEPVRRRVALKVIKPGLDSRRVIARFEAERQVLARMDHPNIARVLDAGTTSTGRPYFVMELVPGTRITEYCDAHQLSIADRLELFVKVCQAVQHAHQKGIIHRDLKPTNILVSAHDGVLIPKIIDFGIAKATEGRLTEYTDYTGGHHFMGTPAYMSPEQTAAPGGDLDTRSDIYSLGVILYELLTARTPFESKKLLELSVEEMCRTIREQEPLRPSALLNTLPEPERACVAQDRRSEGSKLVHLLRGDLDWIVMKCLEKERGRRYETANGLAMDVRRYLATEPIVARPPSAIYRFQKLIRRNRLWFGATTAVLLVLLLGFAVNTQEVLRVRRAEKSVARHLYTLNLELAQQAWEQGSVSRVEELLDETADYPDRGFEWYYWQRQVHGAAKTLSRHLAPVTAVAISPDGERVVTGSEDRTAVVWERPSGRALFTLTGHAAPIRSVAFSSDGRRIVTASADQTARVWEAASGAHLMTLNGHVTALAAAVFSDDGEQVSAIDANGTVILWRVTDGKQLFMSAGGNLSITAALGGNAAAWMAWADGPVAWVSALEHRADPTRLLGSGARVASLGFSADNRLLLTGSEDGTARLWEAATGSTLRLLQGHNGAVNTVALSENGQRLVTGGEDQTVRLWESASGSNLLVLKGHTGAVRSVALSKDGRWIVSGSSDHTAKIWDSTRSDILCLKGRWADGVTFSPDGSQIVTGGSFVWDALSGRELFPLTGPDSQIAGFAYSKEGQYIAAATWTTTVHLWHAETGKKLNDFGWRARSGTADRQRPLDARFLSIACSPNGKQIATGGEDNCIDVWDAASGRRLRTLAGHQGPVRAVCFSPDGRWLLTGGDDQTAILWTAESGKERRRFPGHTKAITAAAFSPDSLRIVTASEDRLALVWRLGKEAPPLTLRGHTAAILTAAFSPDGRRILTGGEEGVTRLWEAESGQELLRLQGTCAGFSPDGFRIVTGGRDWTARVWQVAKPSEASVWRQEKRAQTETLKFLQQSHETELVRERRIREEGLGAVKDWLVALPIPLDRATANISTLERELIPNEALLHPRDGDRVQADGNWLMWHSVHLRNMELDFSELLGEVTGKSDMAYAVAYLQCDRERKGVIMKVGSDDAARVYLNGKLVQQSAQSHWYQADQEVAAEVELQPGINTLVFKVFNLAGRWRGSIRFTDSQGFPLQGLSVTLAPGTKP